MIVVILVVTVCLNLSYAQQPARPKAPVLTSDDLGASSRGIARSDEEIISAPAGTEIRNPRTMLESILSKMNEMRSARTRFQAVLPGGERDVMIESVKPDRVHVLSSDGEMIVIGRKFYVKTNGAWQVTTTPTAGSELDSALNFQNLVREMLGRSQIRVSGKTLGTQSLDVEAIVYEFTVSDRSDTGTIRLSVGKDDGFVRRMVITGGGLDIRVSCSDINEAISIEPPM